MAASEIKNVRNFWCPRKKLYFNSIFEVVFPNGTNKFKLWWIPKCQFRTIIGYDFCNIVPIFFVKEGENCNFLDIDSQQFQNRFRFPTMESSTRFPIPILDALVTFINILNGLAFDLLALLAGTFN